MADDIPEPTMSGVAHLSDEQVAELKKTFALFDRNGDGSITVPELGTAMRSLGMAPTEAELKDLVGTIDTDENGNIEYQEFLTLMARKLKELESPDTLINAFKVFDKEDSGYISVAEFRHLMTNLGDEKQPDEVVDEMIKMADVDESGQIQYIKFVHDMLAP